MKTWIGMLFLMCLPLFGQSLLRVTYDVRLTWDTSSNAAAYRVYWGTNSGQYPWSTNVGTAMSNILSGLTHGQAYFYTVTALSSDGTESDPSNEVSTIPPFKPGNMRAEVVNPEVLHIEGAQVYFRTRIMEPPPVPDEMAIKHLNR